jgi:hypothetical protein
MSDDRRRAWFVEEKGSGYARSPLSLVLLALVLLSLLYWTVI